jgi:hypothetical protein
VFSVRSMPRCYKHDSRSNELGVKYATASKYVNTEAEKSTGLEAVTRQPAKTQQAEKT